MTPTPNSMPAILGRLSWFARYQRGAVSLMTAISLPLALSLLVLAVDVSYAISERNNLQGIADNAARAAAMVRSKGGDYAEEAYRMVEAHGLKRSTVTYVGDLKAPNPFIGAASAVEVWISKDGSSFFGSVLNVGAAGQNGVQAAAAADMMPCLVALGVGDETGVNAVEAGIDLNSQQIDLWARCAVWSNRNKKAGNSPSGDSITVSQGARLCASTFRAHGQLTGEAKTSISPGPPQQCSTTEGLLYTSSSRESASIASNFLGYHITKLDTQTPIVKAWPASQKFTVDDQKIAYNGTYGCKLVEGKNTLFLAPGYYPKGMPIENTTSWSGDCAGVKNIVLSPGDYYVDSANGAGAADGVKINGATDQTLVGNGVTLALIGNATFIANGGQISLTAPESGAFPNAVIVGNSKTAATLTSTSISLYVNGNVVLPRASFELKGNIDSRPNCLTVVASRLVFNAIKGTISGGCKARDENDAPFRVVGLIK